jgi:hypothetical protein
MGEMRISPKWNGHDSMWRGKRGREQRRSNTYRAKL